MQFRTGKEPGARPRRRQVRCRRHGGATLGPADPAKRPPDRAAARCHPNASARRRRLRRSAPTRSAKRARRRARWLDHRGGGAARLRRRHRRARRDRCRRDRASAPSLNPVKNATMAVGQQSGNRERAMPIKIIGMIGVTPPRSDATLHVIEGGLSPDYVTQAARAHEESGFDLVLVGYSSSSAEGFLVALHAAARTERLGYLIAHRPGFVAPTLMARKIATFDHLTQGRIVLHVITGKTDDEQEGDGDFTPKAERYRRAAEYLELMKLAWASEKPFDFTGEFYQIKGAHSDVRPLQKPHPLIFFGGASDGALEMGARLCDVYAIYAEPLASTRERLREFRARAAAFGRTPGFNVSVRPILAATEGAAWDRANKILAGVSGANKGWTRQEAVSGPVDNAGRRLFGFALERD